MLSELLQERAALYATGAMLAPERENFELVLEFHEELRRHVAELQEVSARVAMAGVSTRVAPPANLKERLLQSVALRRRPVAAEALVVADSRGCIEWVNTGFTALCGYELDELRGRRPGEILQGEATDQAGVERIRRALRTCRPCREILVNYHKDGSPYHVDLQISPVLDDEGAPLWFVATERKLSAADVEALESVR
jgi:PAS domain S-box-containing protein